MPVEFTEHQCRCCRLVKLPAVFIQQSAGRHAGDLQAAGGAGSSQHGRLGMAGEILRQEENDLPGTCQTGFRQRSPDGGFCQIGGRVDAADQRGCG